MKTWKNQAPFLKKYRWYFEKNLRSFLVVPYQKFNILKRSPFFSKTIAMQHTSELLILIKIQIENKNVGELVIFLL